MREDFSLLIKPVSLDCNLRCKYCFYLKKTALFGCEKHLMSDEILEKMIKSFLETDLPLYAFSWQGGEPLLSGIDFFKRAVNYMIKYGQGKNIANTLQSNAVALNDEWADFFREYNFFLGLSLDGPKEYHDLYRVNGNGAGSHDRVLNGIKILRKHQVDFNLLSVVTRKTAHQPLECYRYLRDVAGCAFHQYIECVEFDAAGKLQEYAVTPELWGEFWCQLFDEWNQFDRNRVSVRLFDSLLHKLIGSDGGACALGDDCRRYLVVEHDGGVYPCDFHVDKQWRLGNIAEDALEKIFNSEKYKSFGIRKSALAQECIECRYRYLCAGCCPKNRRPGETKSFLCRGWKMFFEHAETELKNLACEIINKKTSQQSQ
ncbi:MAG: anaerobic sulfatase maturase [Victivallaceae bacterium]